MPGPVFDRHEAEKGGHLPGALEPAAVQQAEHAKPGLRPDRRDGQQAVEAGLQLGVGGHMGIDGPAQLAAARLQRGHSVGEGAQHRLGAAAHAGLLEPVGLAP